MRLRGPVYLAVFAANLLVVVAIWWAALEPRTFETSAGAINAAGRITALVGTYLVLVQLVLRTHVPWLVTAFTKDDLRRWHTRNGYIAFALLGAHTLLQIVGYALQDRVDVLSEVGLLLAHYEGMLLAFASLALLGLLTVLALERYRHRIPWPTWRALHLYTYVAVALSVPHQLATGSDFLEAPLAATYWTALLVAVVGIIAVARLPPLWLAATAGTRPHPAIVGVAGLVLAAYLAGTVRLAPTPPPVEQAGTSPAPSGRPSADAASATPTTRPPASGSLAMATLVIEGDPVDTPYGVAQVRAILSGDRLTDVEPMLLPSATRRSATISASAEYWLRKRAIAAQSANFDVLSGATYTSRAYIDSLESALRAARLR